MSLHGITPARFVVASFLLVAACGGGDGGTSGTRTPTSLEVTAGNGQTGPVGAPLTTPVRVKASDSRGAIAGVSLHAVAQSGFVTPQNPTTNADGVADISWTLGGAIGPQTLTISVTGGPSTTASASGTAGAAAVVVPTSLQFQVVVVGRVVPVKPTVMVTDAFGNPRPGITVTFATVPPSNSIVAGGTQVTDASGTATVGSWTMGPDAGTHVVRASIAGGASADFQVAGAASALTIVAGDGQTANAGTAVPVLPAVKAVRDDNSPLPGISVSFAPSSGGGQVQGGSAVTGNDGIARPTRWILGVTPGPNGLTAVTLGANPLVLTATGVPAAATTMVASSATSFTGLLGNFLSGGPAVTVRDGSGNPVAGASVVFQTTAGDGALFGATQPTDFLGRASIGAWRLGNAGVNTVQATLAAIPPVPFTATGTPVPPSTFSIEVRYVKGPPAAGQKAAFDQAVARWTQLILAGAPPYLVVPSDTDPTGQCPTMTGQTVDGIVIYADLSPIDGPGKILGSTGVCVLRDVGFLPVESLMQFDTADLAALESRGQLSQVILHEMAHALGYGTIWDFDAGALGSNAFLIGAPGADPTFNGAGATAAFSGAIAPGTTFTGTPVPVENTGGGGTIYVHWRKSVFGNEILTGILSDGATPLSAVSVQQFKDLGYTVNDAAADFFTFQAHLLGGFEPAGMPIVEGSITGPIIVINRQGGVVARIPRK